MSWVGPGCPCLRLQVYAIDDRAVLRKSHLNPYIKQLYTDFFKEPCGKLSHALLHTTYTDRWVCVGGALPCSAAHHVHRQVGVGGVGGGAGV